MNEREFKGGPMNVYHIRSDGPEWWVVAKSHAHAISRVEGAIDAFEDDEAVEVAPMQPEDKVVERTEDGEVKTWTAKDFAAENPNGLLCSEW